MCGGAGVWRCVGGVVVCVHAAYEFVQCYCFSICCPFWQDEPIRGVLTILCNHSFHIECLTKWTDNTCPICRYYQSPNMSDSNTCAVCGCSEVSWCSRGSMGVL